MLAKENLSKNIGDFDPSAAICAQKNNKRSVSYSDDLRWEDILSHFFRFVAQKSCT
jgi:hypothetical protein